MALLEKIRRQTDTTGARIVFGAVVLVFVFWGVGASGGPTTREVAVVNGDRITETQLQRQMRQVTRGSINLNEDESRQLQMDVLDNLIDTELRMQAAEQLDIEVSEDEVGVFVMSQQGFRTDDGVFSKELYTQILRRQGLSKGAFESSVRQGLTLDKLEALVTASVSVSDAEVELAYQQQETRIEVSYVYVPDAAFLEEVEVQQADIDAHIETHAVEIEANYFNDYNRLYHQDQQAQLHTIMLRTDIPGSSQEDARAKMADILVELEGGASFSDLAERYSEDLSAVNGGNLGVLLKPQMDPTIAEVVFETPSGQVTSVVENGRGVHIFLVGEVTEEQTADLESVQADIAKNMLAKNQVRQWSEAHAEKIRQSWATSENGIDVTLLESHELSVQQAGPFAPRNASLPGANDAVLRGLSAVTAAGMLDEIYAVDGGLLLIHVDSHVAPDPENFETQRDRVKAQLLVERQTDMANRWLADLRSNARITVHMTF